MSQQAQPRPLRLALAPRFERRSVPACG